MHDPILAEVRQWREAVEQRFPTFHAYCAFLRRQSGANGHTVVQAPKQPEIARRIVALLKKTRRPRRKAGVCRAKA